MNVFDFTFELNCLNLYVPYPTYIYNQESSDYTALLAFIQTKKSKLSVGGNLLMLTEQEAIFKMSAYIFN